MGQAVTGPDEAIRRVIDEESVRPRLEAQRTYMAAAAGDPLPVARAELLYLWDEFRAEYLDFASLGHPAGHSHPMVANAVAGHARYYGRTAPQGEHLLRWPVEYARELSAQFSGRDGEPWRVLYTEGEREAVTQAVRLVSARGPLLTVGGDYDWLACGHLTYPPVFDPADADWGRAGALLINLADPQAHTMRPGVARRWMLAARAEGVPVVVDETVTGFGRLGTMWGHQSTGLAPDAVVLGGAVGGGWPLGAVVAQAGCFLGVEPDVSPQAGHPVACAAGSALLGVITLGVLEYVEESSVVLSRGLDEVCAQFPGLLSGHHGHGLLRGLRFARLPDARRFSLDCRAQGLYVAPPVAGTVLLAPPLITSTTEMTRGVDLIASTLLNWNDEGAA